jgi:Flagellar biosynthesis pathway, component FlhA
MVHRTLQQLVREGVPIRPLPLLLEIMADHAAEAGDPERLTEQVRQGLARTICRRARDGEGRLPTVRLTEATVTAIDREGPQEGTGRFDRQRLVAEVRRAVRPGRQRGSMPVVVVPPSIRRRVREMLAASLPEVQVLSTSEIAGEERVEIFATVGDGALRAA